MQNYYALGFSYYAFNKRISYSRISYSTNNLSSRCYYYKHHFANESIELWQENNSPNYEKLSFKTRIVNYRTQTLFSKLLFQLLNNS